MQNTNNTLQPTNNLPSHRGLISLLNFDPRSKEFPFLTSPRSIEACKRLHYHERELLMKTEEDFVNEIIPREFADDPDYYIKIKKEHYEKRRQEKLKQLIEERNRIIRDEPLSNISPLGNIGSLSGPSSQGTAMSITLDKQDLNIRLSVLNQDSEKKITDLKNKQKKEINYVLQNEIHIAGMKKKNQDKVRKLKEFEDKRYEELENKNKLYEEARRKKDYQMQIKELEMEQKKEEIKLKFIADEEKRQKKIDYVEQKRKSDVELKEIKRKKKELLLELRMNQIMEEKRKEHEEKMKNREEKLEKIQEMAIEKQLETTKEADLHKQRILFKLQKAKEIEENQKEEYRQKLNERQIHWEQTKEKVDKERKEEFEERRKRSEQRLLELKKALDQKYEEDQLKKELYLNRCKLAEEKREKFEKEREKSLQEKILRETEREERFKMNFSLQTEQTEQKNKRFLESIEEEQMRVYQRKLEHLRQIKKKYITELLHIQDTMENNIRLDEIRDDKKKQYFDKMLTNEEKLAKIQREKEILIIERRKIQEDLEKEKLIILYEFQKKKDLLDADNIPEMKKVDHKQDKTEYSMLAVTGSSSTGPKLNKKGPEKSKYLQMNTSKSLTKVLFKEVIMDKELNHNDESIKIQKRNSSNNNHEGFVSQSTKSLTNFQLSKALSPNIIKTQPNSSDNNNIFKQKSVTMMNTDKDYYKNGKVSKFSPSVRHLSDIGRSNEKNKDRDSDYYNNSGDDDDADIKYNDKNIGKSNKSPLPIKMNKLKGPINPQTLKSIENYNHRGRVLYDKMKRNEDRDYYIRLYMKDFTNKFYSKAAEKPRKLCTKEILALADEEMLDENNDKKEGNQDEVSFKKLMNMLMDEHDRLQTLRADYNFLLLHEKK